MLIFIGLTKGPRKRSSQATRSKVHPTATIPTQDSSPQPQERTTEKGNAPLDKEDLSGLLEFFLILDRWDREQREESTPPKAA